MEQTNEELNIQARKKKIDELYGGEEPPLDKSIDWVCWYMGNNDVELYEANNKRKEKIQEVKFYELYKGEEPPIEKGIHWIRWYRNNTGSSFVESAKKRKEKMKELENKNQCDGCQRGLPIDNNGNHIEENGRIYMRCEASRYK